MDSAQPTDGSKPEIQIPRRPRRPNYTHIHRNLLPIQVHSLPPLIPHNPISLLTIAFAYVSQILKPPQRPSYDGYFSSATSSIHVTDPEAVRALWEMGFFGRGSLSRSEPNWQQSQTKAGFTAEENTNQRRRERRKQKRERARKEQEEVKQQLSQEVQSTHASAPNILKTNENDFSGIAEVLQSVVESPGSKPTDQIEPLDDGVDDTLQLLDKNSTPERIPMPHDGHTEIKKPLINGQIEGYEEWKRSVDANGLPTPPPTSTSSESSQPDIKSIPTLQRQKTVRFSPTIEAREFDLSSPVISPIKRPGSTEPNSKSDDSILPTKNEEHLHISLEEAFFLSYSLGVLNIYCDDSNTILPSTSLLPLFRRHSYHPPRSLSVPAEMDDPFMLSYAAYHHYRSLGWVVRSGVKFGVDYLLYNRGPAFSHADFAVIVMPSYAPEQAEGSGMQSNVMQHKARKTWWWLHGVNRVQAQVYKQLVLSYVKISPPKSKQDQSSEIDIAQLFSRYKVRDVNVKRWTPNRARD